ncbi:MAG: dihydrolipoamide acetyltransferase family protein [Pseudoclavibacter sp.]|nr:dihydrolipoamide acetyltransferase family protein [Pseudoclavibacter sp.]
MSKSFLLPDLGEGLTEAVIVSWLVEEGGPIAIDQPFVEVESAKSVVQLPSPYGGTVARLHGAVGDTVLMGEPLLTVEDGSGGQTPEERAPEAQAPEERASAAAPAAGPPDPIAADIAADAASGGSGAVLVGYGTSENTVRLRRPAGGRFGKGPQAEPVGAWGDGKALPQPERGDAAGDPRHGPVRGFNAAGSARRSPVVSPIVRKLARDHGFDASRLRPRAEDGIVRRTDVEAEIARREQLAARPSAPEAAAPPERTDGAPVPAPEADGTLRLPLSGLRKVAADRFTNSRRTIPEATIWMDVDASGLLAAKARLQQSTGERFGLTALVARFAVAALRQYPILNASVDEERGEIVQHGAVHLGIAAQTGRGLMVPVVRDAHTMNLRRLRDAIASITERSEQGHFPPEELSGGTFTVNNYGGFGVDGSAPIINHPEAAMLGIGRLKERPWVVDGELCVRTVTTLTFVFDHRVCDGEPASRFLNTVARCIEDPIAALAEF